MKNEVKVKIKRVGGYDGELPKYISPGSSGLDLTAFVKEQGGEIVIAPGEISLVPTGIAVSIPEGFEGQVRPRSGLALNHGITVLNSPGTIDSGYRGVVKVILVNHGRQEYAVERGNKIAQLVVARVEHAEVVEADSLSGTARDDGGFGSTGA